MATEEVNQISNDVRDAKTAGPSYRADTGFPVSRPAEPEVALPIAVSISAALISANPKSGDKRFPVDNLSSLNLSPKADGVQWAGEPNLLVGRNEKSAFVSQLVMLGYRPHEFRVAVRRVPSEGHDDTQERYTVLVIQLRNGALYRERRYFGGRDAEWVNDFSRTAATDFPRNHDFS